MKSLSKIKFMILCLKGILIINLLQAQPSAGHTEITKWQFDKKGAVSLTFDDGTINQFKIAVPIMNALKLPGTFFIITGTIPGSVYHGKFVGRPAGDIINESKSVPTNHENFYERASAARFLGFKGTSDYFTKAGAQADAGKMAEAYKTIDELYKKVSNGEFPPEAVTGRTVKENVLTWEMIKNFAGQGHEFGSHMIDHPYLGALDDDNMLYEIEKSREEIFNQLGLQHTFSAETPYCSQDERVMQNAEKTYPAIRSQITDHYFQQIRFLNPTTPVNNREYVQWQRGLYTRTTVATMKAWVDTTASRENIWLVPVIHGIDGIGWESLKSRDVDEFFRYIKSKEDNLWFATYGDVTRYIRERMNSEVKFSESKGKISVSFTHSLDRSVYNVPLTLKTVVPSGWKEVTVSQGNDVRKIRTQKEGKVTYVLYQALPGGEIEIRKS